MGVGYAKIVGVFIVLIEILVEHAKFMLQMKNPSTYEVSVKLVHIQVRTSDKSPLKPDSMRFPDYAESFQRLRWIAPEGSKEASHNIEVAHRPVYVRPRDTALEGKRVWCSFEYVK